MSCLARISPFFLLSKTVNLTHHILKLYTMIKAQLIEQLRSRSTKVYSNGKLLDNYRLYGDQKRKKYYVEKQQYDENSYNQVQNFLYKQALFGLSIHNKR